MHALMNLVGRDHSSPSDTDMLTPPTDGLTTLRRAQLLAGVRERGVQPKAEEVRRRRGVHRGRRDGVAQVGQVGPPAEAAKDLQGA